MKQNSQYEIVYFFVKKIPNGRVATYGNIAKAAGIKSPRLVGRILHHNPDPSTIPCHRVVNFQGNCASGFSFGGKEGQAQKLRSEGVIVENFQVPMKKYEYFFDKESK